MSSFSVCRKLVLGLASAAIAGCIGEEPVLPTTFTQCEAPYVLCDDSCVSTYDDPLHCGDCDTACAEDEACHDGTCGCGDGALECDDGCVNYLSDPFHCGNCHAVCDAQAGEVCSLGQCTFGCGGGTELCDDTCVNTRYDAKHCGSCGTPCGPGEVCSNHKCGLTCSGGTTRCGTSCIDTDTDPVHCGDCNTTCDARAGEVCVDGDCVVDCADGHCPLTCSGGTTRCDDDCRDLAVDPANCGACGVRCDELAACREGKCTCPDGYSGNGKTCTDIDECAGTNDCSPIGVCVNVPGSYACHCRDSQTGDGLTCAGLVLVTRNLTGGASGGDISRLAIGGDARYVAFVSSAHDLVPVDTAYPQAYVRDVLGGTTLRASVSSSGEAGNTPTQGGLAVSTDGNLVAFVTSSWNLGSGSADYDLPDLFVRNVSANSTSVMSETPATLEALGGVDDPEFSDDARYLVFGAQIRLTNDALADRVGIYRVEVGTTNFELVDLDADGNEPTVPECDGYMNSFRPSVSGDGSRIAFENEGFGLTDDPDENCLFDVFVRDLSDAENPTTTLVSVTPDGNACTSGSIFQHSTHASISADGNLVAFESGCIDLVGTDTQDLRDVFVRDLKQKTTRKVSVDLAGGESNSNSWGATISADGRYVAFVSDATDLITGDTNNATDLFVRDLENDVTIRVSLDANGDQINAGFGSYAFAHNGHAIAFLTESSLLPEDTNSGSDIYLRYLK